MDLLMDSRSIWRLNNRGCEELELFRGKAVCQIVNLILIW